MRNYQPARGLGRPSYKITPLLESICGSERVDPKTERSSRMVILLTPGDPRVDPSRIAALGRFLASRAIPAPHSPSSLVSRLSTWPSRDPSGELGPTLTASLILQPIPLHTNQIGLTIVRSCLPSSVPTRTPAFAPAGVLSLADMRVCDLHNLAQPHIVPHAG